MTICYIWIERFRNFKNTGFNLSSKYKFDYNHETKELTKVDVEIPVPKDFFGEHITEVTGLIGENGTGKSNAVELICKVIKNVKSKVNTDYLIVYEENNQFVCRFSFKNETKIKTSLENVSFRTFIGEKGIPSKIIFFSNVSDDRRYGFGNEIIDISENTDKRNRIRPNKLTNFNKQYELIRTNYLESIGINVPNQVLISIIPFRNSRNIKTLMNLFGENYSLYREYTNLFNKRIYDTPQNKNRFLYLYIFNLFSYYILDIKSELYSIRRELELSYSERITEEIELDNNLKILLKHFLTPRLLSSTIYIDLIKFIKTTNLTLAKEYKNELLEKIISSYEIQLGLLAELEWLLNYKNIELNYHIDGYRTRSTEFFELKWDSNSKEFIENINRLSLLNIFTKVDWLGISSGYKAYFNIFSKLYHELKTIKNENIFLCIDEGDLYLHPKWQIEFFKHLIEFLEWASPNNYQLLLTSHSPFLLSDLPKQNVTILESSYGKTIIKNGEDLKGQTFGANLYDLYSEPFMLGNQRMSAFSKQKIIEIVKLIKLKEYKTIDNRKIEQLIELIGDRVIKFNLDKMLNEK